MNLYSSEEFKKGNSIYERISERSDRNYKANIWDAAIGLQVVDGLKTSEYLRSNN